MSESPTHHLVPASSRAEWDGALDGIPHAFGHTWDSCHAFSLGSEACWLYCYSDAAVRIVCPLVARGFRGYVDVVTPYGFAGFVGAAPLPGFRTAWLEFGRSQGWVCAYVSLNPVLSSVSYFGSAAERHRTVFMLDLRLSEDELFARLSTNRRRQVVQHQSEDWLVVDDNALTAFFVGRFEAFMRSRRASHSYFVSSDALSHLCTSPKTLLLGATRGGKIVAASMFGYTPFCGDYVFNVSVPGGQEFSVPLIWAGMRRLQSRGVPFLNLGGGVREGDTLEEFKRRFGADQLDVHHVRDVFRSDVYDRLCADAGTDAGSSDYFPAYRTATPATASRAE